MKGTADTVERETLGEVEESRMTRKRLDWEGGCDVPAQGVDEGRWSGLAVAQERDVRVRVDSFVYKCISISHTGLWPASGQVPV